MKSTVNGTFEKKWVILGNLAYFLKEHFVFLKRSFSDISTYLSYSVFNFDKIFLQQLYNSELPEVQFLGQNIMTFYDSQDETIIIFMI